MAPHKTTVGRQSNPKNTLGGFAVMVIAWASFIVASLSVLPQGYQESFGIVFFSLCVFVFLLLLFSWLHGKMKSGPLLLDFGPHPKRKAYLFVALAFAPFGLLYGLLFLFAEDASGPYERVFAILSLFSFPLIFLIEGLGRRQIRENGIWLYYRLLGWQKLESCVWGGESESTLILKIRTKIPFLRQGLVLVPPEHRSRLAHLTREHCPSLTRWEQEALVTLQDGTQHLMRGLKMADYSYSSRKFLRCDTAAGQRKIPFSGIRKIIFSIHWPRTSSSADHLGATVELRNGKEIQCTNPSAWHIYGADRNGFDTAIHMGRRGGPGEPGRTTEVTLRFLHDDSYVS